MTTVVGIDHSLSRTGIVIVRDEQPPEQISVVSTGKASDGRVARGRRMRSMRTDILDQIPRDADLTLMEGLSFGHNFPGQDRIHHLWWLISDGFDHLGLPLTSIPPGSLKKWATDNGNADKAQMKQALSGMWPGTVWANDDVVDAGGCATIAAQHLGLPLHYLVLERHSLAISQIVWP